MAEYVTRVRTESGDLRIDYQALANLPQSDITLKKSGSFADALATGNAIKKATDNINSVDQKLTSISEELKSEVTAVKEDVAQMTPESIGALPDTYVAPVTSVNGSTGEVVINTVENANNLYAQNDEAVITRLIKIINDASAYLELKPEMVSGDSETTSLCSLRFSTDILNRISGDSAYAIYDSGNKPIKMFTIAVPMSEWIAQEDGSYVQEVSLPGVTASNTGHVDIDMSLATVDNVADLQAAWSMIGRAETILDAVKFTCYFGAPELDLSVIVEVID